MSGPRTGGPPLGAAERAAVRGVDGTTRSTTGSAGAACPAATAPAISDLIWSLDNGPRRYDNAQRLWNVIGAPAWTSCSRNTRLPSDDRVLSAASRSRPPDAA